MFRGSIFKRYLSGVVAFAFLVVAFGVEVEPAEAQISTDRDPTLATAICMAPFSQPVRCRPDPVIVSELNRIDPFGNNCEGGLCTNDTSGPPILMSVNHASYYSPAVIWTQSQDAELYDFRVIVFGADGPLQLDPEPHSEWEQFEPFDYRIDIWDSFQAYKDDPGLGNYYVTPANLEPANSNRGEPVGYTKQGFPNFEWIFDLSEFEIPLEAEQEYVMMVRAIGTTENGWIHHATSTWEAGPDVMGVDDPIAPPNYMDLPPWDGAIEHPRLGSQIRVKVQ